MIIREIQAKNILSKSRVYDYVINPYTGCSHSCTYCYARFMKRFTGHKEPWGEFVDVKCNAPDLLQSEINRKKPGRVWISGVCDPYQPLEAQYQLTHRCLEILVRYLWPVTVQTRSPLVLRDLDLLKQGYELEVGITITTADDHIRRLFEPRAPPIAKRIATLDTLHQAGIRTFAMIAPLLPGAEGLGTLLPGKVDSVLIDRMNYFYARWVYQKYGLEDKLRDDYFSEASRKLVSVLQKQGIETRVLF